MEDVQASGELAEVQMKVSVAPLHRCHDPAPVRCEDLCIAWLIEAIGDEEFSGLFQSEL